MAYTTSVDLHKGVLAALNAGAPSFATLVGGRITPAFLPQDSALPALVYTMGAILRLPDMSDMIADSRVTFEFECYGTTHAESVALADALDATLREVQSFEGMSVQEIERLSILDLSESQGDVMVWRISTDYGFYFQDL